MCDIPIIGFGTRLNEYRSGQDVDKMARTVTVVDMLVNQVRSFQTLSYLSSYFGCLYESQITIRMISGISPNFS